MCRYSRPYKRHFACFTCRKAFKRVAFTRTGEPVAQAAPCPDCGREMAEMGLDFKAPRRSDLEHWEVVAFLYHRGFAYHSCGCSGPGYRPSRWAEVPAFLGAHCCRSPGEILAAQFAARSRTGLGDYTRERDTLFARQSLAELVTEVRRTVRPGN